MKAINFQDRNNKSNKKKDKRYFKDKKPKN